MKKKMNVILSLLLVAILVLVGCQGGGESTDANATESAGEAGNAEGSEDTGVKKVSIVIPIDHLALNAAKDGISQALIDEYGEDGVEITVKNANGEDSLLNTIMTEVIGSEPDIIMPIATGAAQVAATSTSEIPIVFSAVTDPVEAGLTPSWEEAGKNITGVSDMADIEAVLDFGLELYPEAKTFGIVYNSAETNSIVQVEMAKKILDEKGLSYKEGTITNTSELQQVVENLAEDVDIFYSPTDNDVSSAMPVYVQVANKHNLPIFPAASTMVEDGGTGTVGLDYYDLGLQAGAMAIRILNGESVADNPPELVEKVTKILNEDQVATLGLEVPEAIAAEVEFVKTVEE